MIDQSITYFDENTMILGLHATTFFYVFTQDLALTCNQLNLMCVVVKYFTISKKGVCTLVNVISESLYMNN